MTLGTVGTPTWNLWQQGWASGGIFLKLRAAAWTFCPPPPQALTCTLQGLIRDLWGVGVPSQKAEGAVGPASWLDNHGKRPLPLRAEAGWLTPGRQSRKVSGLNMQFHIHAEPRLRATM